MKDINKYCYEFLEKVELAFPNAVAANMQAGVFSKMKKRMGNNPTGTLRNVTGRYKQGFTKGSPDNKSKAYKYAGVYKLSIHSKVPYANIQEYGGRGIRARYTVKRSGEDLEKNYIPKLLDNLIEKIVGAENGKR